MAATSRGGSPGLAHLACSRCFAAAALLTSARHEDSVNRGVPFIPVLNNSIPGARVDAKRFE